jgi:ankyrin repeat protein
VCANGYTPLHLSCRFCKLDIIKFLVDNGADILAVNRYGDRPIQLLYDEQQVEMKEYISTLNFWIKPAKR